MSRPQRRPLIAAALVLALVASSPLAADERADFSELLARAAPAIVNLRIVVKTQLAMGDSQQEQESTLDARGAVVDPRGLILLWNSQVSSNRLMEIMSQMGSEDMHLKLTPAEFHVRIRGEEKERSAFLAASDTELDIAFLQIEPAPSEPLAAIDFAKAGQAGVGQTVVSVSRLGQAFDFAPYFETARIGGELAKPRRAWILDFGLSALGLPVFSANGEPIGVLTTVLSRLPAETATDSTDFTSLFPFARQRSESGSVGVFVLPAERVRSVIAEARKRADQLLTERAADGATPPKSK
jgi:S1-C subfamily serine protease